MTKEQLRVVTVGGGTGSPIVNEALLRTGKVDHIKAVAAVYDSGGATGRRRSDARGQEIAYSDPMRILLSLASPEEKETERFQTIEGMFHDRDEYGKVLGQDIFNRFYNKEAGFSKIEDMIKKLGVNLKGHVLPSSTKPTHITFTTFLGREFRGEHHLDDQRMSTDTVDTMKLDPEVDAYTPATKAVRDADVIVIASGSVHGSVLVNFLPRGMIEALQESEAKMFAVTNLVSTRNETHKFTPGDFITLIEKYAKRRPDGLIVPEITRREFESQNPRAKLLYESEHAHFLGWEPEELYRFEQEEGIQIFPHQATTVLSKGTERIVRHDPEKLASTLDKTLRN